MKKKYGNYITERPLGHGSFGEVWEARNQTTGQCVALKLEPRSTTVPQLFFEERLYKMFHSTNCGINTVAQPCNNIPAVYAKGQTEKKNYLAMELLGKSLEDIITKTSQFSEKTVLLLAGQMISCVEYVHKFHYIHRDIKPDNFVMGVGRNSNKVYIIDFGLSKKFIDHSRNHIKNCSGKSLTGTARYASINALEGYEQSRRDDMESLFYVWIYCLRSKLPWMGLPNTGVRKYEAILRKKRSTKIDDLCSGLGDFFKNYWKEIRKLKFDQEPDYAKYRAMVYQSMIEGEMPFDYVYDWSKRTNKLSKSSSYNDIKKSTTKKLVKQDTKQKFKNPEEKKVRIEKEELLTKKPMIVSGDHKPYIPTVVMDMPKPSHFKVNSPRTKHTTTFTTNTKEIASARSKVPSTIKSAPVSNKSSTTKKSSALLSKKSISTSKLAAPPSKESFAPKSKPSTARKVSTVTKEINSPVNSLKPKKSKVSIKTAGLVKKSDKVRPSMKDRTLTSRTSVSYKTAGSLPKWMLAQPTHR